MFSTAINADIAISIDENGRITLPKITGISAGDELAFRLSLDRSHLIIETPKEQYEYHEQFEKALSQMMRSHEKSYKDIRWLRRIFYGIYNYMPEKVDKNRRITIPEQARHQIGLERDARIVLKDGHLELYKPILDIAMLKKANKGN